jgi:hypothetical protein
MNAHPGPLALQPGLLHRFLAKTGLDLRNPHH